VTEFVPMKKTRVSQILKKLLADKKIRVAELARRINLPQPTVHRIVAGTCEHPHISSLEPIASFFSISVEQLKGHEPIHWLDRVLNVPLLSWKQVIVWPDNKNDLSECERILTDAKISENGYALRLNDVSMDPVFPKNTILIADPDKIPKDRSYVVVKLSSFEEPIFRQLLIDASDRYLKSLSPDLDQYKMIYLNGSDKILSTIVQAKRDYEE
jgi:transcriptional regulator with XRE-family HTH domain